MELLRMNFESQTSADLHPHELQNQSIVLGGEAAGRLAAGSKVMCVQHQGTEQNRLFKQSLTILQVSLQFKMHQFAEMCGAQKRDVGILGLALSAVSSVRSGRSLIQMNADTLRCCQINGT